MARLKGRTFDEDQTMAEWSKDEPGKIAGSDDLHIAPLREDGKTYGTRHDHPCYTVLGGFVAGNSKCSAFHPSLRIETWGGWLGGG